MVNTLLWSLRRAKPRPPAANPAPHETHALSLPLLSFTPSLFPSSLTHFSVPCPLFHRTLCNSRLPLPLSDMTQLETLLWKKAFHRKTPSLGCRHAQALFYYSLCMLNKDEQPQCRYSCCFDCVLILHHSRSVSVFWLIWFIWQRFKYFFKMWFVLHQILKLDVTCLM